MMTGPGHVPPREATRGPQPALHQIVCGPRAYAPRLDCSTAMPGPMVEETDTRLK